MAVALTSTPAAPRSKVDTARIGMTGLDAVTPCYVSIEKSGVDTAKSPVFVGAADGTGLSAFMHIFPSAGTYTVLLRKASDDSDLSAGGSSVIVS